ncbi:MAG TPA: MarR family transcriptional regulator [Candidatus Saccharimonadia bacterium]|nr:MarR family transcriptional regulator [Candidatus Saccharimonadia bacterium]
MNSSAQHILDIQASCACLQARGRARELTKAYDQILAPSGLKITQFSPLSILLAGSATISDLAEAINIDRTTLTRVLAPLQHSGYITTGNARDARKRIISLTEKGIQATKLAYTLWKEAQALYATSASAAYGN